jgi:Family of unknown function (DUF6580)
MKKFSFKLNSSRFKDFLGSILVFVSRFAGFIPNFSPLGSYGFFSGNLVLFFASIVAFDLLKGGLYRGFIVNYLGFLAYWLLGKLAKKNKQKLLMLPLASFSFFLISNFGVWLYWYEHSWQSLATCYLVAVPFYKNTLLGDLFFGYGFMGLKAVLKHLRITPAGKILNNFAKQGIIRL